MIWWYSITFVIFQLLIAPYTFDISIELMLMSSCPDSCALLKSSNEAVKYESVEDFLKCSAHKPFFLTSVAPRNDFIFEKRIKAYEFEILHDVKSASTNVQIRKGKGMIGCAIVFNSKLLEKL